MNHTDEQLIQEYSQEVFGSHYDPEKPITVEQLIEHSRQWRKSNADTRDNRKQGYNDGYERGYSVGLSRAARNAIPLDTLREMTINELCELCEQTNDDPVQKFLREEAALRSKTHLTLGKLISYLENTEDHPVANLSHPHSYRGYYSDLAFEQEHGEISSKVLLATCKKLVGRVFVGYKGGEYQMTLTTPLWIANWGVCGRPLIALNGTNVTLGEE